MTMRSKTIPAVLCLTFFLVGISISRADESLLRNISLPPGFSISVYADNVPDARSLAFGPADILFVGTLREGKVYAVIDRDGDHVADEVITLAKGLNMPNGVAFLDNDLYINGVRLALLRYLMYRNGWPENPASMFLVASIMYS